MQKAMMAAALVLMLTAARAETVFTATNGHECKDSSKPEFGNWVCPGPRGYAVHFMDEGNMVGITIAPSRSIRAAPATSQWMGAGKYSRHVSKVPDPDVRPINLEALIDSKEISARFEPETVPLAEGRLNGFFNPVFPG